MTKSSVRRALDGPIFALLLSAPLATVVAYQAATATRPAPPPAVSEAFPAAPGPLEADATPARPAASAGAPRIAPPSAKPPVRPQDAGGLPILQGAIWKYFKGQVEPPASWKTIGFDDASWLEGPSGFGYGDNDDATVLSDMQNNYLSVYTRKAFDVPDPSTVAGLELKVNWDDGFVAYVNGQEVARRNLTGAPGTFVAFDIPASNHEAGTPETISVDPSVLVAGTNVIAVQGHNTRLDSSDLTLIVELRAVDAPPSAPSAVVPADGATNVSLDPNLCVTAADPDDATLDVSFFAREAAATPTAPFTIVVLPDAQYYSATYPATFRAQTQWIVDNRLSRNIVYVTQVGDCTDQGAVEQQWINADAAFDLLEDPATTGLASGIPFGGAVGNHDQSPAGDPGTLATEGATTPLYNQYFGTSRFGGRSYYGGHYGSNNDNHFDLFSAAGMDFIVLYMEYMPTDTPLRQSVLAWADSLLKTYANRRAIVTTHYVINPGDASWSDQGLATWNALKNNHNLALMLCGHLDQANRRYDEYTDAGGTTKTYTMVADYQSRPSGGNGWLRLLTFRPDSDTIEVETYSPTLGVAIDNHADNLAGVAQNHFTLGYDMPGGPPFTQVGAGSGPAGSQVCAPWPGRRPGTRYEWYAVVSDGTSSTTGATSTFTTRDSCVVGSDCDDLNPCTTDSCDGGVCRNEPIPGCCATNADCDDGNVCTDDACNGGTCQHTNNTVACDDGDGCTVSDVCAGGVCAGTPSSCDDGNVCTVDSCVGGRCVNTYTPTPGCCVTSDDCDDGLLCSADSCQGGTCTNVPNANCCDTNSQCDDGDVCTSDRCVTRNLYSVALNGADAYVSMGAAAGLGASQFTLEAWVYPVGSGGTGTDTGTGGLTGAIPIVSKGRAEADATNQDMNYFLGLQGGVLAADFEEGLGTCDGGPTPGAACWWTCSNSSSRCSLDSQCGGGTCTVNNCGTGGTCLGYPGLNHPVLGTTPVTAGAWHHVAATYDGACWQLYLDGVADTPGTTCPNRPPRADSIAYFGIGTAMTSTGAAAGFLNGYMDEVRVWNRALTAGEIAAGKNEEITSGAGLIGRWGLDEGTGAAAADSTVPPENGTLTGGASWEPSQKPVLDGGTCAHDPVPNCCHSNAECDDANPCTQDTCDGTRCEHVAVAGCCVTAADCSDGNPCTDDVCTAGVCSNPANTAPCDDGNLCTTGDACSGGACTGAPIAGCCTSESQCDDGNACTSDSCTPQNVSSLALHGIGDYVTMGSAPGLNASPAFTVEAWINGTGGQTLGSTGTGGISLVIPLVAKGGPQAESPIELNMNYLLGLKGGMLVADFEDSINGTNHPICGSTSIGTGWHHVAATYDGTSWKLYVDGAAETLSVACTDCPTCTASPGVAPVANSIQHFAIGTSLTSSGTPASSGTPSTPGYYAGKIDEVRIWSVARTQAEIQADMGREITGAPGLIGRWGLNENGGTTAADSTSPAENGTFVGTPAWEPADVPDLGGGTCSHGPVAGCCVSSAECDDGNPCTTDTCTSNACSHTPAAGCCVTAADCNDGNPCTDDVCAAGVCSNPANSAACDDGNPCTTGDACVATVCVGTSQDAFCNDGNACTADACVGASGGKALAFDGVDDYVTFGNPGELGAAVFTIETWFYRTGAGVGNTTGSGGIASLVPLVAKGAPEADGSNVDGNYMFGINTAGNVLAADFEDMATGLNHPVSGTTPIADNTWYHAAASYDGTTWRLYLNGNLEATLAVGAYTPRYDSIQRAALGAMLTSNGTRLGAFQGILDEVRIWNVARSQADIQFGRTRQITAMSGLVARWGLDEGTGSVAADSTTPSSNGTLTNFNLATAWVAGAPDLSTILCSSPGLPDGSTCPDDGNPCTTDRCTAGACGHPAGNDGASCSDLNACTTADTCSAGSCAGTYAPTPGCCTTNAHCNDGIPATVDTCVVGTCLNELPVSCTTTVQCDDGNACTADACVGGNVSALKFDGTNDYVTMGPAAGESALGARAFTLEAWIRRDGTSWGATTSTGTGGVTAVPLVTKGRGEAEGSNVDCNYFLGITAGGRPVADFEQYAAAGGWSAGQNHPACSSASITDQNWHHVAVTYSTADGWRFYVDGVEGTTADGTSCTTCSPAGSCPRSPGVEPRYDSIQHFALGAALRSDGTNPSPTGFYAGMMDEARVWNRALTQAEIQSGKNQELTSSTGLIGRWGLNENGGTTAGDSTSPAQNGTLTESSAPPVVPANGPSWRSASADKAPIGAGTCQRSPIPGCCTTNAQCDDGNACTGLETCGAGNTCQGGTPVVCTALDACHVAGACDAASGACSNPNAPNGTACDDGNPGTVNDVCTNGICGGTDLCAGVTCAALDQCHDPGVCDPATGQCSNPVKSDGTACSDGNACTRTDSCQSGTCVGASPVMCTALDPCHDAGVCDTGTGACSNPSKPNGTTCNDGNACTGMDTCESGACVGASPVICTALDQCHDAGVCDAGTGVCSNPPKPNGTTCNDGNACTGTDTCESGACVGASPVICAALDQCHDAGVCDAGTGTCSNPPKPDGTTCDDNNPDTVNDVCANGVCGGTDLCSGVICAALDQCHDAGVCDHATGQCSNPVKPDGATCNDGNACTRTDSCEAGTCVGANPVVCTALDQCHDAGACDTGTGQCSDPPKPNGTTCNDGNACTRTDTCESGACVGASPVICTALDQCHDAGTCDTSTGQCSNPSKPNGTTCNDGNACTRTDSCEAGACVGANPVVCTALDQCHDAGTCDTSTGQCSNPSKPNGTTCNDGNACTRTDSCESGVCVGANPVACTALDQCHDAGVCDTGTGVCSNPLKPNGTACNDGNACTGTDTCESGACVGASPVICAALDQCHDAGVCDAGTGTCSNPPKPDGTTCDDNNPDTVNDVCANGVCGGTDLCSGVICTALDQCHDAGVCDPATGQCSNPVKPDGATCNDGNACTRTDSCESGVCVGANPVLCTALDQCHDAGTCDTGTGQCSNPPKPNGTTCNDGNACTRTDSCESGVCVGANPVICTALDQCHDAGVCDTGTGACSNPPKPNGTTCNDGNACTGTDTCESGACVGANPVVCTALDQCHDAGVCDSGTGACSNPPKPNGTTCNDGNACTRTDTCESGTCVGASPVICTALDLCHDAGVCDTGTGACSNPPKPNGTTCNDGNACTGTDTCESGACVGASPVICAALDQCHDAGVCDTGTGACSNPLKPDGTTCDDNNPETVNDVCANGVCGGTDLCSGVTCAALDQCHEAGVCDHATGQCSNPVKPDGATCNDGNACTRTDSCEAGACVGANPVACTALDQCHDAGVCDTGTGVCSNPPKPNGTTCNDGNACTRTDSCESGACVGANPVICAALDQCHDVGVCDIGTGVCSNPPKPNGTTCNDGNACTRTDSCEGGACVGANLVVCTALDPCHDAGVCDTGTGVCTNPPKPNGTTCDDGNACTSTDRCDAGVCTGGAPLDCNDGNPCTDDSCAPATGCAHTPNDANLGPITCGVGACERTVPGCLGGQPQTCTPGQPATANVPVLFGSEMRYRANLDAPGADATLVELGSTMRYLANSADPGLGLTWTEESYDASGWTAGTYGVGYDQTTPPNALALIQTSVPAGTSSVFTRAEFRIDDPTAITTLLIGADYDDGWVAWINGVEVARSSTMPAGTPAWNTAAALHESSNGTVPDYGSLIDVTATALPVLHAGTNVLAIGVWNANTTSTDLVLVPKLAVGDDWKAPGYDDSAWSVGTYGVGYETQAPGAQALIRTSVPAGTHSVFTRARFEVSDPAALERILIAADYDDGWVAWINGVEVYGSAEMGRSTAWDAGAASHESSNGTTPNYGTLIDITARAKAAIRGGTNVLAIGIWNVNPDTSTDLVLVPRLSLAEPESCNGIDDNCDGVVDEGWPDRDGDGTADCVDPDNDNDGVPDTADCAPWDPSRSAAPPEEVANLQWSLHPQVLTWSNQGSGVVYDAIGGMISALSADLGVSGAACLGNGFKAAQFDDTRPAPPAGDGYYYLVRSGKASCGNGTYGRASSGAERVPGSDCP